MARGSYYNPGEEPAPRKPVDAPGAARVVKVTRQMRRAAARRGEPVPVKAPARKKNRRAK